MAPKKGKTKVIEIDELKALQVKMLKKVEKHLDGLLAVALSPKIDDTPPQLEGLLDLPPLPPLDFGTAPLALEHRLVASIPLLANIATARNNTGQLLDERYAAIEEFILSDVEETVEKLKKLKSEEPKLRDEAQETKRTALMMGEPARRKLSGADGALEFVVPDRDRLNLLGLRKALGKERGQVLQIDVEPITTSSVEPDSIEIIVNDKVFRDEKPPFYLLEDELAIRNLGDSSVLVRVHYRLAPLK